MDIEVTHDFGDRYRGLFFGLEVKANVYVAEDEAEVKSWHVEGVRMPISDMPVGLCHFMAERAKEEWEAEQ